MSLRGPIPLPREVVEAKGNPSKRPLPSPRKSIDDDTLPMNPPALLGTEGKAEWKRIRPSLEKAGRWKARFYQVVLQYCLAYEDLCLARKIIRKEGLVLGIDDEERELHPAFKVQKDATERMNEGIKHLGLSPMQEIRIGSTAPEQTQTGYEAFRRAK